MSLQIEKLEHNNQRVVTTKQLAEFYGCEPRTLSDNFNRHIERFEEGKHYFLLQGEAKRSFINDHPLIADGSIKAEKYYLWTKRGAARHAKILSTDKAWQVFEELEDNYFNAKELDGLPERQKTNGTVLPQTS